MSLFDANPGIRKNTPSFFMDLHGAKRAKAHVRVDDGRQAVGDGHGGQGPPKGLIQGIQCGLAIHWWNCWRQIDSGWLVDG